MIRESCQEKRTAFVWLLLENRWLNQRSLKAICALPCWVYGSEGCGLDRAFQVNFTPVPRTHNTCKRMRSSRFVGQRNMGDAAV
ncbi:hypothetical protein Y1Q_0007148 [Alligator mississippiensis]|uniref:Uncharacterized protein n=1 Tax=Alligator mississippiensis TaxID=8496 RepID=A0A151N5M8_ALLMI|nr:hypothetical protein Y1Q_0007148 [Alligator mississippiensis]